MKTLRRFFHPGSICFLTHITKGRRPLLIENLDLWRRAITSTQKKCPFDLIAWVALPDHVHLLIDSKASDVSHLMKITKMSFAESVRNRNKLNGPIWQHRFWDHLITDQKDFETHLHYIHYNPVKHGVAKRAQDYRYSSMAWYVENGFYDDECGDGEMPDWEGDFGE